MLDDNFDFGGHIEDDTDVSPCRYTEEEEISLSPYGLILNYIGYDRGKKLYEALQRSASTAAEQHGGVAAIAFDVDGGRFVAITAPQSDD